MKKLVLALAIVASAPGLVLAQTANKQSKCGDEGDGGTKYEIARGPDGRKIFRIKTFFCIEGKVPKPSVIYVLNASTINYEWETLKQDFLPRIRKAAERPPF